MSELKCPFCNLDIRTHRIFTDGCDNTQSPLWQELIRTRKALDVAKKALQELKDVIACPPDISYETGVSMYTDGALQEITTLEQKDVK